VLLFHIEALFAEPVDQGVFVDFLQVSVPVIAVNREAGFADDVAELIDIIGLHGLFCVSRVFCGPLN
jgi:hypothetical protein